jgi:predicted transcriptional regulator
MTNFIELTARIVASHAKRTMMTTAELVRDLQQVHSALHFMESGAVAAPAEEEPALTVRQAFKKDEVVCMICGKGGFKTLAKHLKAVHDLKPGEYRKQFGLKSTQKLAAKSYSDARRKAAAERGMTAILAKAREKRAIDLNAKKNVPVVKTRAAVPVAKQKAPVPAVKTKAAVPVAAKKVDTAKPAKTPEKV